MTMWEGKLYYEMSTSHTGTNTAAQGHQTGQSTNAFSVIAENMS